MAKSTKQVVAVIKLQISANKATPAPRRTCTWSGWSQYHGILQTIQCPDFRTRQAAF